SVFGASPFSSSRIVFVSASSCPVTAGIALNSPTLGVCPAAVAAPNPPSTPSAANAVTAIRFPFLIGPLILESFSALRTLAEPPLPCLGIPGLLGVRTLTSRGDKVSQDASAGAITNYYSQSFQLDMS